ncbi:MAG: hypothetical protein ACLQUW_11635 [Desulfobaccales bacterium]
MKKIWRLPNVWALALAGLMLLAGPALAQNQGGGPVGKTADHGGLCTGGPNGTCVVNPAANKDPQKCPTPQQQCPQAPQGVQCFQQPKTQANPPASNR